MIVTEGDTHDWLRAADSITVSNGGAGPAPLANIMVNLQARGSGGYYTVASASIGDPSLLCGTAFSYIPTADSSLDVSVDGAAVSDISTVSIAGYGSIEVDYAALFDLEAVGLASGDQVRVELLVTFANAGSRGGQSSCLVGDTYYRTVPIRDSQVAPGCERVNASVTLSDLVTDAADPTIATVSDLAVSDQGAAVSLGSLASDGSSTFTDTIVASGLPGTLTVYDFDGTVTWPATCSGLIDPSTSVTNSASLTGSGTPFAELGDTITGSPASASVSIAMEDGDGDCVCGVCPAARPASWADRSSPPP